MNDSIEVSSVTNTVTIMAYKKDKRILVESEELKWNMQDEYDEYLSLKEISEQLEALEYEPVYIVWEESALEGVIYQFGNDNPQIWEKHGQTRGFA